tara:strand:+ start:626 stop:1294 length:669 start_codon:yes stop_codon:yes gene_type:complete
MKTFKELIIMKRYIDWLISKQASITLLPFDIIEHHIINKLDWFSNIRFLYAILPFYRSEDSFLRIFQYNFLLGDVYQNINILPLKLMNYNHPYFYEAHILFEWSPFSSRHPYYATVAIIKPSEIYPYHYIDYKNKIIERLVAKQVNKKILQARLSVQLNFNNATIANCIHYSRRKISFHNLPFSVHICNAYSVVYDLFTEKISMDIVNKQISAERGNFPKHE